MSETATVAAIEKPMNPPSAGDGDGALMSRISSYQHQRDCPTAHSAVPIDIAAQP